jgi:hypothetical protein
MKGSFEAKKSNMEGLKIKYLFFVDCLSTFSFP